MLPCAMLNRMTKSLPQAPIPTDLVSPDTNRLAVKIADFEQAGANQLQLVFDFDRTLTVARPGLHGDITTWSVLKEHLPQSGKDRYQELFEHYRALEIDHTLDQAHAITWWSSILDLFAEHRLSLAQVEDDFLSKATIRPQTKELFDLCAAHAIPTVILSAGIKEVIELWAQTYDIKPSVILSTALQIGDDKRIHGWDRGSLVHVLNKNEVAHPELSKIRAERSRAILVGDSINDAAMAEGVNSVFRILIHDPRRDEKTHSTLPPQVFPLFDAVIQSGSLLPVRQLVEMIVSQPAQ